MVHPTKLRSVNYDNFDVSDPEICCCTAGCPAGLAIGRLINRAIRSWLGTLLNDSKNIPSPLTLLANHIRNGSMGTIISILKSRRWELRKEEKRRKKKEKIWALELLTKPPPLYLPTYHTTHHHQSLCALLTFTLFCCAYSSAPVPRTFRPPCRKVPGDLWSQQPAVPTVF